MLIRIALPQWSNSASIPEFLKQLELCVHHAKKAYAVQLESAQGNREDDWITFKTPYLDESIQDAAKKGDIKALENVADNFYDERENIVLEINVE